MKWLGIRSSTPVDDTPGALTQARNVSLYVSGQLGRRKGMARTSLAKQSGAIRAISDFAVSPGLPRVVTNVGGAIDGAENVDPLWGDAAMRTFSGTSTPETGTDFTLSIERDDCAWADGVLILARLGAFPTDTAQGTLVGQYTFSRSASNTEIEWTAPSAGAWHFRVFPTSSNDFGGAIGKGSNLEPTAGGGGVIPDPSLFAFLMVPQGPFAPPLLSLTAPPAHVTSNGTVAPSFDAYAAYSAGDITLPYSFDIVSETTQAGDFLRQFVLNGVDISGASGTETDVAFGVVIGTVTIAADGSASYA